MLKRIGIIAGTAAAVLLIGAQAVFADVGVNVSGGPDLPSGTIPDTSVVTQASEAPSTITGQSSYVSVNYNGSQVLKVDPPLCLY